MTEESTPVHDALTKSWDDVKAERRAIRDRDAIIQVIESFPTAEEYTIPEADWAGLRLDLVNVLLQALADGQRALHLGHGEEYADGYNTGYQAALYALLTVQVRNEE